MGALRTCCNPPFSSKNELARAFTKEKSTLSPSPVVFQTPTPALTQASTPTSTPASAQSLSKGYIDEDFQRVTKLVVESFVKGKEHG